MNRDDIKCVHCGKKLNPTAAFMDMLIVNKKNLQKANAEYKRTLTTTKQKFSHECESFKKTIKDLETHVANEKKVNKLLITDYEQQISNIRDSQKADAVSSTEMAALKNNLENIRVEVDRLKKVNSELENLRSKNVKLKEVIKNLKEQVAMVNNLKKEKDKLEESINNVRREISTTISEKDDIIKDLNDRIKFQLEENKKFIGHLTDKAAEVERVTENLDDLATVNEVLTNEKKLLEQKINDGEENVTVEWDDTQAYIEKEKKKIENRLKKHYKILMKSTLQEERDNAERKLNEVRASHRKSMYTLNIPMDSTFISENIDSLKSDHLRNGAKGVANFLVKIMKASDSKANYICVDMMQKKFKYVDRKERWIDDGKNCEHLKKVLYLSIGEKCSRLLEDLRQADPRDDDLIGSVMNTVNLVKSQDKSFHASLISFLAPLISTH